MKKTYTPDLVFLLVIDTTGGPRLPEKPGPEEGEGGAAILAGGKDPCEVSAIFCFLC